MSIILRVIPIKIPKKYKIEAPYWSVTRSLLFCISLAIDQSLGHFYSAFP